MTVMVRPVHLDSEREKLLEILQSNLPDLVHSRRFEWLYRENPDGPAWSWFACEKETRKVVGVTSMFPRSMWVGGKVELCGQVGDFAISPSHRSLGPALLLQRATFEPVNEGTLAFCYDCPPHEAGMSTFRRLGLRPNCQVDRYARPLRVDRQVKKRLGRGWAAVAAAGNLLLRLHTRGKHAVRVDISEHTGPFGEEFSQLDAAVVRQDSIRGRRGAAHLNWRYRKDPLHQYRVLTARRGGELMAFVVFRIAGEDASIVDLFGRGFPKVAVALLDAVVQQCYRESVETVEAFISDQNELSAALEKVHFCLRSTAARVVAYARPRSETSALLENRSHWSFNQAEILA